MKPDTHADVARVVAQVQRVYAGWRRDTPAAQMREDWDRLFATTVNATLAPVQMGDLHAEWVTAPGVRHDRALLYFHGGGFRVGSCVSHRELMVALSAEGDCRVLGVDYRLLPEHRLPAQQEDARAAWAWLMDQGWSPAHVALGGDSAGAWLVLSLLLALRDEGQALPAGAITMSALTDFSASGGSFEHRAALDPIHQRPMIQAIGRAVLPTGSDPADPAVSPLFADLRGLPPLLMQVGDHETVLDDTTVFAAKARQAGVDARDEVWPGMVHVFQQFPLELAAARQARVHLGRFLRARLRPST